MEKNELKKLLDERGINPKKYSLSGEPPAGSEGLILEDEGKSVNPEGSWGIYHFERGKTSLLARCSSLSEACAKMAEELDDPFYRA